MLLTCGHFYANRAIVVDGFAGTLRGAGSDETIVEAVRNPEGDPTPYAVNSQYVTPDGETEPVVQWPTLLHLEYPGDVEIRRIRFHAANPVDPSASQGPLQPAFYQLVVAWGGNGSCDVRECAFTATADTETSVAAPHVMRGTKAPGLIGWLIDGTGRVDIRDCELENLGWGPIIMWFRSSHITVKDIEARNVVTGLYLEGLLDGKTRVSDCRFRNGGFPNVLVRWSPHTTIKDCLFDGVGQGRQPDETWYPEPAFVLHVDWDSFDVVIKDNRFAHLENEGGESPGGAIWCRPWGNQDVTIKHNDYPKNLPLAILLESNDSVVREPSLGGSQVLDLGTNNKVRVGD